MEGRRAGRGRGRLDGRLELLQGARIRLFLRREGTWKEAVVEAFHARSGRHRVKVGDGAPQILLLKEERWLPLGTFPPSPKTVCCRCGRLLGRVAGFQQEKGRGAVRFAEAPAPPPEPEPEYDEDEGEEEEESEEDEDDDEFVMEGEETEEEDDGEEDDESAEEEDEEEEEEEVTRKRKRSKASPVQPKVRARVASRARLDARPLAKCGMRRAADGCHARPHRRTRQVLAGMPERAAARQNRRRRWVGRWRRRRRLVLVVMKAMVPTGLACRSCLAAFPAAPTSRIRTT